MLILYNPPSSGSRKPVVPLSLLALGAVMEGEIDYTIIDGNLERDERQPFDFIAGDGGADILGVTVMPGPQLNHAVPLCRWLKERHPALTIVWGGYFPTQHHDSCLRSGLVDYVIRGCGELVFKQLVEALRRGEDTASIPSLAYVAPQTGEVVANPIAGPPHPDSLPDLPYHRLQMERYVRDTFLGSRTLSHHSSYGCPFSCSFCAVKNMTQGRWYAQSGARLAEVVESLVDRFSADAIEFFDNCFFVDEERVASFAERILPLGLGWWGEARIDTLERYSDRTWQLMRDSGLKMVFMGAESGSDETLRMMNKGGSASTDATLRIAARMKDYGIVPEFSFVVGNPPGPERDVATTLEFIRRLKRVNPLAEIIIYMYTPVPNSSPMFDEAAREGFRFPATLDEWLAPDWREFSQRRETRVPWLTRSLRRRVRDFECVLNAYYPTATNPRLRGLWKWVLKTLSAWRYHARFYRYPVELALMQKLISYRRPETSGF